MDSDGYRKISWSGYPQANIAFKNKLLYNTPRTQDLGDWLGTKLAWQDLDRFRLGPDFSLQCSCPWWLVPWAFFHEDLPTPSSPAAFPLRSRSFPGRLAELVKNMPQNKVSQATALKIQGMGLNPGCRLVSLMEWKSNLKGSVPRLHRWGFCRCHCCFAYYFCQSQNQLEELVMGRRSLASMTKDIIQKT